MAIDFTTPLGQRALARLTSDPVEWVTTVKPDGQPQSSPIWFLHQDDELLLYSHRTAQRTRNIAVQPLVSVHLNDVDGEDVFCFEGVAEVDPFLPPTSANPAYQAKYGARIAGFGWAVDYMDTEYPTAMRIRLTRLSGF
ncbi:MAG: pyridoxamine 5'-phosphate oxidase family protein [Chloroflexi bacterium]|nr:pyridoxamine 5'-phosphate oxidase family protein [Chloroflexota bacterium]